MCNRKTFKPTQGTALCWFGPKDQQNKMEIFLSVYGVMYVIIKSRKPKGKGLREWIMRNIIPIVLNDKIKGIKGQYDNEIKELKYQQEASVDHLTQHIEAIQLESEEQQEGNTNTQQRFVTANRHVARRGCFDKVLCFIKRNSKGFHPYYVIRCQYTQREKHKR